MAKKRKKTPPGVRRRKRADGTEFFYGVVTRHGRQISGPVRETAALAHADYLRLKAEPHPVTVNEVTRLRKDQPSIQEALDLAVDAKRSKGGASDRTINTARINVKALLSIFNPEIQVRKLTAADLNTYIRTAEAKGRSLNTIREKDIPLLKAAFKVARVEWPSGVRTLRVVRNDMDFFLPDELSHLLERVRSEVLKEECPLREKHAFLFEFLARTGARSGEMGRVSVKDIDLKNACVTFTNNKNVGKARKVPLSKEFLPVLSHWLPTDGPASKVVPGGMNYLSLLCARWKARLDEPRLSGRTLRHSFVTGLLISGVDPYTVMQLAGHTSLTTTMRYVHLVSPHTKDAIARWSETLRGSHGKQTPQDR